MLEKTKAFLKERIEFIQTIVDQRSMDGMYHSLIQRKSEEQAILDFKYYLKMIDFLETKSSEINMGIPYSPNKEFIEKNAKRKVEEEHKLIAHLKNNLGLWCKHLLKKLQDNDRDYYLLGDKIPSELQERSTKNIAMVNDVLMELMALQYTRFMDNAQNVN